MAKAERLFPPDARVDRNVVANDQPPSQAVEVVDLVDGGLKRVERGVRVPDFALLGAEARLWRSIREVLTGSSVRFAGMS